MNESQALAVLSDATEPQTLGKISRQGFVAIEQALAVLTNFVKENTKEEVPVEE